jgi:hypothetical protein
VCSLLLLVHAHPLPCPTYFAYPLLKWTKPPLLRHNALGIIDNTQQDRQGNLPRMCLSPERASKILTLHETLQDPGLLFFQDGQRPAADHLELRLNGGFPG